MEKDQIIISPAKPEDAEAILMLKRESWLQTYPNEGLGVTREDIDKKLSLSMINDAIPDWQRALASETENGSRITFVARLNNEVIGYTSPHEEEDQYRLGAMYVTPAAQHKGVGGKLLQKAMHWIGNQHDIYVYVVSYNENAIAFYKHFGFRKTGKELPAELDKDGLKLLPEIEMVRQAA